MTNLEICQLIIYIQSLLIITGIVLIIWLARKSISKGKLLKKLEAKINTDYLESSKLYIDKSEQDLQLFFQFENVLEEIYKQIKKLLYEQPHTQETMRNIELILSELLKNK